MLSECLQCRNGFTLESSFDSRVKARLCRYRGLAIRLARNRQAGADEDSERNCFLVARAASVVSDCEGQTARSEMDTKKPNPELIDDENPEWADEMFARAVPFSGLPPGIAEAALRGETRQA